MTPIEKLPWFHLVAGVFFRVGPLGGARTTLLLLLISAGAGCGGGGQHAGGFDGRRGYGGSGDYGYDLAASRAEARGYRARAARDYPAPGSADDPWGPYIRRAAARHQVPERWVREVMRQESGGRQHQADGTLTTSSAGAMGLMQVMPGTYHELRQRYGLGDDPYLPEDNILAGAAYIREMYDRFGSPAFLAAYNAGPARLSAHLAGDAVLADETVNYLANVAPRLGTAFATDAPWHGRKADRAPEENRAYAGGGRFGQDEPASDQAAMADPADRAFDGGGLVTADAPTGRLTGMALAARSAPDGGDTGNAPRDFASVAIAAPRGYASDTPRAQAVPISALLATTAPATRLGDTDNAPLGGWGVQVGAFPDPASSRAAIRLALGQAGRELAGSQPTITPVQREARLYRARLVGLSASDALAACTTLQRGGIGCFTVPPGS